MVVTQWAKLKTQPIERLHHHISIEMLPKPQTLKRKPPSKIIGVARQNTSPAFDCVYDCHSRGRLESSFFVEIFTRLVFFEFRYLIGIFKRFGFSANPWVLPDRSKHKFRVCEIQAMETPTPHHGIGTVGSRLQTC